ncbi:MAG: superoxide dismutase, Ni [Paraglaciecola sp.]|uniref:superoxide dismutase, Ni n=1 Tax=Paraglaciecola sp. TaxID=1920173 RepID=UPI003297A16C
MIHSALRHIDKMLGFNTVSAHCDIPCKIYDPSGAQVAALSVIRFLDLINELADKSPQNLTDQAQLLRLVREKEIHAKKVKDEITVIWGDYFKQPQFEQYPDIHQLVHSIMLAASACKQHVTKEVGHNLLDLVNQFSEAFWTTKGVETYTANCPYPPSLEVVYPKLA